MFLGIDTSTSCGWAILGPSGMRLASGTWDLHPHPGAGEGPGARFTKLHEHLDRLLVVWPRITRVSYEIPGRMKSQANYLACYGITTHVESWAERHQLTYAGFAPAEVKNAAGLKGNAQKHEMIAAAESRWSPYTIATDDEADALFVALAYLQECNG